MTGTEWAEAHRVIPETANKPGPYRVKETPWGRGIMDALVGEYITHVSLMKPAQIGGTTLGENVIGAWTDMDPSGILIVFSTEDVCKKIMRDNIIPLFRKTPKLRAHLTGKAWDVKTGSLQLRSCQIVAGWAGSVSSLASVPYRRVMLDEIDKHPKWSGKEADSVSLGEARANTYKHRKKIYKLSTPTIPQGPIARAIEGSGDIRDWCIRCARCERYIRPEWEHVTWDGQDVTDETALRSVQIRLETRDLEAHYECPHCNEALTHEEVWAGSQAGGWLSVGCEEPDVHPLSRSVGFRVNGLCGSWLGVQGCAVEFVKARLGGLDKIQHFYNSIIGVPFWGAGGQGADMALTVTPQKVWDLLKEAGPRDEVPDWATVVVAGVDTGKRDHPWVVRAFGPEFRSQLLEYGTARDEDTLFTLLERLWQTASGETFKIRRMLIDSGGGVGTRNMTRTEEVYRIAHRDPARIYATKGHGGAAAPQSPIRTVMKHYRPPGDRYMNTLDIRLSILDTTYWKDLTAGYLNNGLWLPHAEVGREYVMQLASEHKVMVKQITKPDGSAVEDWRWIIRAAGLPNHYWDCEVLATVAAHMVGADDIAPDIESPDQDDSFHPEGRWTPPTTYTRNGSWI